MELFVPADAVILDLLRERQAMTVADFAAELHVTATAVRQRLNRLLAQGYIERTVSKAGRGRPRHRYSLTLQGRRKTGVNFADLSLVVWQELSAVRDPEMRRELLRNISNRLAALYRQRIEGKTLAEKMGAVAAIFIERHVPFTVDRGAQLPVLNALACPYPELAEQDRSICTVERLMISELLGENVHLSKCRLDGDSCCRFELN